MLLLIDCYCKALKVMIPVFGPVVKLVDRTLLKSGNALTFCHIASKVVNGLFLNLFNSLCADVCLI